MSLTGGGLFYHPRNICRLWVALATCLCLLGGSRPVEAAGVRVYVEPVQVQADFGAEFSVDVMIEGVTNLGFVQFDLMYDPRVVGFRGADLGDFLGSTGRSVSKLGPKNDTARGTVTLAGYSFGLMKGPDGSGVLAKMTFIGAAQGVSSLRLDSILLSDTDAEPITVSSTGEGVALVGGAQVPTPGPTATRVMVTNTPVVVPTATPTATSFPTRVVTRGPEEPETAAATPVQGESPTASPTGIATPGPNGPATAAIIQGVTPAPTSVPEVGPTPEALSPGTGPVASPTEPGMATVVPGTAQAAAQASATAGAPGNAAQMAPLASPVAPTPQRDTTATQTPQRVAQATRSVTSTPILPSSEAVTAPQSTPSAAGTPVRAGMSWLIGGGLVVLALAAAVMAAVVLYVVRQRGA